MNDAVAVGVITGTVSALGYLTTYLIQRKNAENVKAQSEVDLAKIEAENERLREANRESERQNRQGTYHRMLAVLDRFDTIATGYAPSTDQLEDALREFFFLSGGIQLFGTAAVKAALEPVSELFEDAGANMNTADKVGSFREGYLPIRADLNEARLRLVEAMTADVTAGIL
jgi:hypothetical protein